MKIDKIRQKENWDQGNGTAQLPGNILGEPLKHCNYEMFRGDELADATNTYRERKMITAQSYGRLGTANFEGVAG